MCVGGVGVGWVGVRGVGVGWVGVGWVGVGWVCVKRVEVPHLLLVMEADTHSVQTHFHHHTLLPHRPRLEVELRLCGGVWCGEV